MLAFVNRIGYANYFINKAVIIANVNVVLARNPAGFFTTTRKAHTFARIVFRRINRFPVGIFDKRGKTGHRLRSIIFVIAQAIAPLRKKRYFPIKYGLHTTLQYLLDRVKYYLCKCRNWNCPEFGLASSFAVGGLLGVDA